MRKHGHGEPWKVRYKVLEVRPHAVLLEIPKDGSVPRINEWQLIRRCEPSPDEEALPHSNDPRITEAGVPLTLDGGTMPEDVADDDALYEVEKILRAEKIGNKYRLWIKWVGYDEPTPMWKTHLTAQPLSDELLKEIEEACQHYRDEHRRYEDESDEEPEVQPTARVLDDAPLPAKRERRPPQHYNPAEFMFADECGEVNYLEDEFW